MDQHTETSRIKIKTRVRYFGWQYAAKFKGVCLGLILAKCATPGTLFTEFGSAKSFGSSSQLLPYGVPLAAGTLMVLAAKMFGWWGIQ